MSDLNGIVKNLRIVSTAGGLYKLMFSLVPREGREVPVECTVHNLFGDQEVAVTGTLDSEGTLVAETVRTIYHRESPPPIPAPKPRPAGRRYLILAIASLLLGIFLVVVTDRRDAPGLFYLCLFLSIVFGIVYFVKRSRSRK